MNVLHQFVGVFKTAFGLGKSFSGRRVTAQGENVVDAPLLRFIQNRSDIRPRASHAGEVRHGWHLMLLLDSIHDPQSLFAGTTAGAVGNRKKCRVHRLEPRNNFFHQRLLTFGGFGREKFAGNCRPPCLGRFMKNIANESHRLDAAPKPRGIQDASTADRTHCTVRLLKLRLPDPMPRLLAQHNRLQPFSQVRVTSALPYLFFEVMFLEAK